MGRENTQSPGFFNRLPAAFDVELPIDVVQVFFMVSGLIFEGGFIWQNAIRIKTKFWEALGTSGKGETNG